MEKLREPGSAKHGNFINYYSFNPPLRRLDLLPRSLLADFEIGDAHGCVRILDIGCNAGDLTLGLWSHVTPAYRDVTCLGLDLDQVLIQRARQNNTNSSLTFETIDVMTSEGRRQIADHMTRHSIAKFDLISCFSVTMWIHLNHGDTGICDFLQYISSIARHLLIEPQPWKCYRNAVRRHKKLDCESFVHFKHLTWRSEVSEDIKKFVVDTCGCVLKKEFGLTEQWERAICLFAVT